MNNQDAARTNNTGNELGPVALQKLAEEIERIKVNVNNIDLTKQNETAIKVELKQINYSSWSALNVLEQDIAER